MGSMRTGGVKGGPRMARLRWSWLGLGMLAQCLLAPVAAQEEPGPKAFVGNKPRVIETEGDGTLRLLADSCEIYGPELEYMLEDRALGYWHQTSDYCVWKLKAARGGTFAVLIEWSCAPESANNAFELKVGESRLRNRVPSSGSWQRHRWGSFGYVELKRGEQTVTIRPLPGIHRALMDLREVRLVPVVEPPQPDAE